MIKKILYGLPERLPTIFSVVFPTLICAWFLSLYATPKDFSPGISVWAVFLVCLVYQIAAFKVFSLIYRSRKRLFKFGAVIGCFAFFALMVYLCEIIGMGLSIFASGFAETAPNLDFELRIINFLDWFFKPGDNPTYFYSNFCLMTLAANTLSAFILFYYTQVNFRISVMFLFTMIPPVLFAKDYREVSPWLIILSLALLFIITVHCRQMKPQQGIKLITNRSYAASVIAFLAFSLAFAILIPKPDIENKRQLFEQVTTNYFANARGFSIDDFTGESNENRSGAESVDSELFRVYSSDACSLLKAYSLQSYNSSKNIWEASWPDKFLWYTAASHADFEQWYPFYNGEISTEYWGAEIEEDYDTGLVRILTEGFGYETWSAQQKLLDPSSICNIIQRICAENPEIAEEFGLAALAAQPAAKSRSAFASIQYTGFKGELSPLPTGTYSGTINAKLQPGMLFQGADAEDEAEAAKKASLFRSFAGRITACSPLETPDSGMSIFELSLDSDTSLTALYYPREVIAQEAVLTLLHSLDTARFKELLLSIYPYAYIDEANIIRLHLNELALLDKMNNPNYYNPDSANYRKEFSAGEADLSYISEDIKALAAEITEGLNSDFEKASALERYFTDAGYKYSLEYSLPAKGGIDDFIFSAKKGSCFHYATAMTLMARCAGLNARYCEGFLTGNPISSLDGILSYKVSSKFSHAFCEVYIAGYGWMSFDPTVADPESAFALGSVKLALFSLVLVILCSGIALLLVFVIFPRSGEYILARRVRKLPGEKSIRLIMLRARRYMKSPPSATAGQMRLAAAQSFGCDISVLCELFDRAVYGNCRITETEAQAAYAEYHLLRAKIRETVKAQKKNRRTKKDRKLVFNKAT